MISFVLHPPPPHNFSNGLSLEPLGTLEFVPGDTSISRQLFRGAHAYVACLKEGASRLPHFSNNQSRIPSEYKQNDGLSCCFSYLRAPCLAKKVDMFCWMEDETTTDKSLTRKPSIYSLFDNSIRGQRFIVRTSFFSFHSLRTIPSCSLGTQREN